MTQTFEIDRLKYKSKLIAVFKAFIKVCEQYQLQYFCIGGTLIGAIRHQGLIPWDDDIDVVMPRSDYDKFINLQISNDSTFEIVAMENSNDYYLPYAKFCDKESTILEYSDIPSVLGLFVDVFPLDAAHDNEIIRKQDLLSYKRLANKLHIQPKKTKDNLISSVKRLSRGQLRTAWNEFNLSYNKGSKRQKLVYNFREILNKYSYKNASIVGNYGGMWGIKEFWKKDWFDSYLLHQFEDLQVRIPIEYDKVLKQVYGDYMKLPPIDKRVSHHNLAYVNLDKKLTMKEIYKSINSQI